MFPSYGTRFQWSFITILAAVVVGFFLAQSIEQVWLGSSQLVNWGGFTLEGLRQGQVWRLLSYALLHDGFLHILGNVLALLFIGLPLQSQLGQRATAIIIGLMALAGSLSYALIHATDTTTLLMGGSAVAVGLLTLYCLSYPQRPITLLLFFVLPVTLMPMWILWFTLGVNIFGFVFAEIAPNGAGAGVAYSAHLGGMIAAWAIHRWCLRNNSFQEFAPMSHRYSVEPPAGVKKQILFKGQEPTVTEKKAPNRVMLQRELDRILDKINTKGLGALTSTERETLQKAKDILGK